VSSATGFPITIPSDPSGWDPPADIVPSASLQYAVGNADRIVEIAAIEVTS
jgi:hypothetical protein